MFYADLHVHSKYSRATSGDCDLEHLALWAGRKGIAVVASGDFTHPGWFQEIQEKLVPAEPGLFRLRPDLEAQVRDQLNRPAQGDVRFLLEVEISTIYKKDERTRKVHHLIYVPDLEAARRVIQSLARIGNLNSDGRPILGLDSRNLLEITLQAGEGCYLVPAHIWTPWFAVLGSKSGFDAIDHCYGDLAAEVFALETGLSSDPAMNWRLSSLDRYALVSNSDAHSPAKLGREACVFSSAMDYFAMREALKTGKGYDGTVEFFPEEGKYHLDGHRKCGVCLSPEETERHGGKCPVCGKPLTLGVMYRVNQLADRPEPVASLPPRAARFRSLIPLDEVLSELHGVGPQSKTIRQKYDELLARVGPELFLLEQAPLEDLARLGSPLLAEAMRRMRAGQVIRDGGYDGEYGTIRLFTKEELQRRTTVGLLFELPQADEETAARRGSPDLAETADRQVAPVARSGDRPQRVTPPGDGAEHGVEQPEHGESSAGGPALRRSHVAAENDPSILAQLDPEQRAAAEAVDGPVLIVAGPGTGKTRTLTHRLAYLIAERGAAPEQCLALTFSRRAAGEMMTRLERLLPGAADRVPVMTFHGLGLTLLRQYGERLGLSPSLRVAGEAERCDLLQKALLISEREASELLTQVSRQKRGVAASPGVPGTQADAPAAATSSVEVYDRELRARGWVDFDDLIALPLRLLETCPDVVEQCRARYRWVSVDEFQDIDAAQYALVKLLVPAQGNLCAIGDPDQSIYGFRGADAGCFLRFGEDYPSGRTIRLARNYRSTQTIVDAALQLIAPSSLVAERRLEAQLPGPEQIEIHACSTERAEAEFVVHTIERLVGGSTFFSLDSQRVESHEGEEFSFADFAVLYRTEAQSETLAEALARSGMPFQRRSHDPLADRPAVQAIVHAMGELEKDATDVPVAELLDRAAEKTVKDDREVDAVLAALRALAARHGADLPGFLSELALGVDADLWDPRADRVALLTLHAAKGLEFPVVFLVGCEDGILPLRWGQADEQSLAEERRLFFVGMTRAEQRLILTHAQKRRWRGKVQASSPSPFLADIERRLLAHHQHRAVKKPASLDRQRTLFD